jgi:SAM-dependent methyltransferase
MRLQEVSGTRVERVMPVKASKGAGRRRRWKRALRRNLYVRPFGDLANAVSRMPEDYFAGRVAERYDETSAETFAPEVVEPVVDFLADLAGGGAALELGIGTGRIAVPLARRGVRVHGIELSPDMVAQLRAKPGGEELPVTIGDFATTKVDGTFSLTYVVFNTIMNLRTQDAQVACFQNVAAHLEPHGLFVVEIMLPELQRLPPGERVLPFDVSPEHLGFDEYELHAPGADLAPLLPQRGRVRDVPGPLYLAVRARPDGPHRGDVAARAVERLEAPAVHEREHEARLGVAEAVNRVNKPSRRRESAGRSTSKGVGRERGRLAPGVPRGVALPVASEVFALDPPPGYRA